MSLHRSTALSERLGSGRNSSRYPSGKEKSHRWRVLGRPWLKHRSNSAPVVPLDSLESRGQVRQAMLSQSLTWSGRSTCCMLPANLPVSRVHSLPDPCRIVSSGILLAHVQAELPSTPGTKVPYLRSVSEPGTSATIDSAWLRREQSNLIGSGIFQSMSRRISKMLTSRDEMDAPDLEKDGRHFKKQGMNSA